MALYFKEKGRDCVSPFFFSPTKKAGRNLGKVATRFYYPMNILELEG